MADEDYQDGGTIMNQLSDWSDSSGFLPNLPTPCDKDMASEASYYDCDSGLWWPCPEDYDFDAWGCCYDSNPPPPLVVFSPDSTFAGLTGPTMTFDMNGSHRADTRFAWPSSSLGRRMPGFLALDKNRNGIIDNGTELFGPTMVQRARRCRWSGYGALAELDRPPDGGNGDGILDSSDVAFKHLRVWFDRNGNGLSEPTELLTMSGLGIAKIDLAYKQAGVARDSSGSQILGYLNATTNDGALVRFYVVLLSRSN